MEFKALFGELSGRFLTDRRPFNVEAPAGHMAALTVTSNGCGYGGVLRGR